VVDMQSEVDQRLSNFGTRLQEWASYAYISWACFVIFLPPVMLARQVYEYLRYGTWPETDLFYVLAGQNCELAQDVDNWLLQKDLCRTGYHDFEHYIVKFINMPEDWVGLNEILGYFDSFANWFFDLHIIFAAPVIFFLTFLLPLTIRDMDTR